LSRGIVEKLSRERNLSRRREREEGRRELSNLKGKKRLTLINIET